jgi:hypothetical protein
MSIEFNSRRKLKEVRTIEEFRTLWTNLSITVVKALHLSDISQDYWANVQILNIRRCNLQYPFLARKRQNGATTKFYKTRSR